MPVNKRPLAPDDAMMIRRLQSALAEAEARSENHSGEPVSASELFEAAREARSALAGTISWLEALHPTKSRRARLAVLRAAHDRLARALVSQ